MGLAEAHNAVALLTLRASLLLRHRKELEAVCTAALAEDGFPPPCDAARRFAFAKFVRESSRRVVADNLHVSPITWFALVLAFMLSGVFGGAMQHNTHAPPSAFADNGSDDGSDDGSGAFGPSGAARRMLIYVVLCYVISLLLYAILDHNLDRLVERRLRDPLLRGVKTRAHLRSVQHADARPHGDVANVAGGDSAVLADSLGGSLGGSLTLGGLSVSAVRIEDDGPPARGLFAVLCNERRRQWWMVQFMCFYTMFVVSLLFMFSALASEDKTDGLAWLWLTLAWVAAALLTLVRLPKLVLLLTILHATAEPDVGTLQDTLKGAGAGADAAPASGQQERQEGRTGAAGGQEGVELVSRGADTAQPSETLLTRQPSVAPPPEHLVGVLRQLLASRGDVRFPCAVRRQLMQVAAEAVTWERGNSDVLSRAPTGTAQPELIGAISCGASAPHYGGPASARAASVTEPANPDGSGHHDATEQQGPLIVHPSHHDATEQQGSAVAYVALDTPVRTLGPSLALAPIAQ